MDDATRGAPLSDERLREFARELAAEDAQVATASPRGFDVAALLRGAAATIRHACRVVESAVARGSAITPAARWLIENVHVLEEQFTDLPDVLPPRATRRLPHVPCDDSGRAEPRIYCLMRAYVAQSDGRFELSRLESFVHGCHASRALLMRELWAVPSMLRLALLLEFVRVAERTSGALAAREQADALADRILQAPASLQPLEALSPPAGVRAGPWRLQLLERLRFGGGPAVPALDRLTAALVAEGLDVDALIAREHGRQGANNVTARNIITSIRQVAAADWREFFADCSPVELRLVEDPSYARADPRTRDRYRAAIEELAMRGGGAEIAIADAVLRATAEARGEETGPDAPPPAAARAADVGYWLVDAGRPALERRLGVRASLRQRLLRGLLPHAGGRYLMLVGLLTVGLEVALLAAAGRAAGPHPSTLGLALFGLAAAWPLSELAIALLNRALMAVFRPRHLPRLALQDGLPEDCATLVVTPVLLQSTGQVRHAVGQLEVHAAGNPDPRICFGLLSDWTDAASERDAGDDDLLRVAAAGIERLNAADAAAGRGRPRFFLFHRRRRWNERERRWMGWERKRGKLEELNALLLRGEPGSFVAGPDGAIARPHGIRYVVTLDADTRLPLEAVADLVGIAAHPLNRPEFDTTTGRVVAGYGIVQPRVVPLLPRRGERSLYRDIVSGPSGMDPYAGAISDVYQDVFREGVFTGKGLYDLPAFDRALRGRIPENQVLSHDLLESVFARAALASDVECYEDFPSHAEVGAARLHRWTRGDWQLLPWLAGSRGRGIGLLNRWKLLDNLRRSLVPPASVLVMFVAWASGIPGLLALGVVVAPALLPGLLGFLPRLAHGGRDHPGPEVLRAELLSLGLDARNALATLALLAQNAWLMCDAIGRALWRQFVTRRRLLEWITAAQLKSRAHPGVSAFAWAMKGATIVVLSAAVLLMATRPSALRAAAPVLLLWWLSPVLALAASRSLDAPRRRLDHHAPEVLALRSIARATWRYFEATVTAEDNHLPPDNLQETPQTVLAHRTSPTNVSLYLLAVASARELGWIGLREALGRIDATLSTVERLEQHRGHLYNWYDTRRAAPLEPRYVSTVDSGNFCAHCIALAHWCLQQRGAGGVTPVVADGLSDTLALVRDALAPFAAAPAASSVAPGELPSLLDACAMELLGRQSDAGARARLVAALQPLAAQLAELTDALAAEHPGEAAQELAATAAAFVAGVASHARDLDGPDEDARIEALAARLMARAAAMDFRFLYDEDRQLFSIGWRAGDGALDPGYYDLLASEARLASFVAIAKGDVPWRHWRHLGRRLTGRPNQALLVSWSGSMFEYLMPALVLREPVGGLLDATARRAIASQVAYGAAKQVPWGISESAYNVRDAELTYQYSAFGVPGLGLKRGLERNLVVAPYATALAAMYRPKAAIANFGQLERLGARGRYGFYESIDFTPERIRGGASCELVRAFMAHHQGMSVVALHNAIATLTGEAPVTATFHADPRVQATELLLEEQAPGPTVRPRTIQEQRIPAPVVEEAPERERRVADVSTPAPIVHLLSNRRYAVMVTAAGGGYSAWNDRAVTRWREDPTRDALGSFLYVSDVATGHYWSATYQPTAVTPDAHEARFSEERAEWWRRDGDLHATLDLVVLPTDDAELRRLTLHNRGREPRTLEVTSYAEVVLATHAADVAHRAFSNLFVRTEWVGERRGTLLAQRRPRGLDEAPLWGGHCVAGGADVLETVQFETDRARFIGRNGDLRAPLALQPGRALSNTAGTVLDPVFSLRVRVTLAPGESRALTFATFVSGTREAALALADVLRQPGCFERAAMQAWTYARAGLHHLDVSLAEARLFQSLAGAIVYPDSRLRIDRDVIAANVAGAPALWRFGISGDRPIVLVRCAAESELDTVRELLRAQEYWRTKQLIVDVVLLNERAHSYQQELRLALEDAARQAHAWTEGTVGARRPLVAVLDASGLDAREHNLLLAAARVVIVPAHGSLADQLERPAVSVSPDAAAAVRPPTPTPTPTPPGSHTPSAGVPAPALPFVPSAPVAALEFHNGFGGFADDGREYVMELHGERRPPLPWSNVIANPSFGTLVTEAGSAFTWSQNSRENLLTPWSNDPVVDPSGEALYLRDEESGALWSPCAQPLRHAGARYRVAHGQGYSRFQVEIEGIETQLWVFVDPREPVKWSVLQLRNRSGRARRLTVAAYAEWSLGFGRERQAPFVVTEQALGAVLARNPWNAEFPGRVAWLDLGGRATSCTGSRREFLGRHGSMARPAALASGGALSGRTGAGFDPCAALATSLWLADGATECVIVTLGEGADRDEALRRLQDCRRRDAAAVLGAVRDDWDRRLGTVRIHTPDRALDLLVNRWLLYQVTSCRMWARAAFYQVGGAFGFRDQLQDSLALLHAEPALVREQLLRAAARQYPEGDVQHWWHPPSGRGVRTRFTDDRLWLPYAAAAYVQATGDTAALEATRPFIEGAAVPPGHEDAHYVPETSEQVATLYEHCARAIDVSLGAGPHGLPLMGGGDWNDGMNRVGLGGRGESVWMAWFLPATIAAFAPLAEARGDGERARAARWRQAAAAFVAAAEATAWDGAWYRRAYFDDGTPLGSASGAECRIDSLAQSWAVIGGAADPRRARLAMDAVREHLVRDADELVLLFTPPFEHFTPEPGYVKSYLPGLRENGAQYTHAAVWTLIAFAMLDGAADVGELVEALNPARRTATRRGVAVYKAEPYVVAADVYSQPPHAMRGGWTWYTGAAGWLHRAVVEHVLGLRIEASRLVFAPCLPPTWDGASVEFSVPGETYRIRIERARVAGSGTDQPAKPLEVELDGVRQPGPWCPRRRDGALHEVVVRA